MKPPVDFVIVTALEEERDAVLAKLPGYRQIPPSEEDVRVYFGCDLPATLAALYYNQGRYMDAEPLYQRALAIREKTLGSDHSDVAFSLNNLATLYCTLGQYAKAESLYERALGIWEKALGPEHPNVATCLENYALLLRKMHRRKEAAPLESRARAIRAKNGLIKNPGGEPGR